MTALSTLGLIIGMALVGVPVLLGVLTPFAGTAVERLLPESSWDGAMLFFAQGSAAAVTFALGFFAIGLPWVACLIAAFVVGITSYARRAPEPLDDFEFKPLDDFDFHPSADDVGSPPRSPRTETYVGLSDHDRDRAKEHCPECGKTCRGRRALAQHVKVKHGDAIQ